MTREQYIRMTEATRRAADRLPGGARALRAPTLLCAAIYCASLLYLMFTGDGRIVRAVLVPAACFAVAGQILPQRAAQRRRHRLRRRLHLSASGGRRLHGAALRADRRPARALRPA